VPRVFFPARSGPTQQVDGERHNADAHGLGKGRSTPLARSNLSRDVFGRLMTSFWHVTHSVRSLLPFFSSLLSAGDVLLFAFRVVRVCPTCSSSDDTLAVFERLFSV